MFKCFKKKKTPIAHEPLKLNRNYPDKYLDLALKITGTFEGSGYDNISGNFDGQGVSAGILQWCYGQTSLQNKILKPFINEYGTSVLNQYFPSSISESADMSAKSAVRFAKKKMLNGSRMKNDWSMAWRHFLTSPECITIQKKAADSVASKAWAYCEKNNLKSAKAFCWFFDIVTQNGSLKGIEMPTDIRS